MRKVSIMSRTGALILIMLTACSTQSEPTKLSVVASIRPLALMVEQLAGDAVEVNTLLPGNADPHNTALRISERSLLEQADLVVWLGPDFEQFLRKPMASRGAEEQVILANIPELYWPADEVVDDHGHAAPGRDMHLWLNPDNGRAALLAIYDHLLALQPDLQPLLRERLDIALKSLEQTKAQIKQRLQPLAHRGFGVDHNAYGHFVSAFGLRQLAAVNDVPGQRMSAKQRHHLQQQLIEAVCFVVERPTRTNQRLAAAVKLPVVVADPLANNPELKTYSGFLSDLGDAFHRCLAMD